MGGTALGASGRSNNGLKLDVKTGKLSLWRLFPTFTFTFTCNPFGAAGVWRWDQPRHLWRQGATSNLPVWRCLQLPQSIALRDIVTSRQEAKPFGGLPSPPSGATPLFLAACLASSMWPAVVLAQALLVLAAVSPAAVMAAAAAAAAAPSAATATAAATAPKLYHFRWYVSEDEKREGAPEVELSFPGHGSTRLQYLASVPARRVRRVCKVAAPHAGPLSISMKGRNGGVHYTFQASSAGRHAEQARD